MKTDLDLFTKLVIIFVKNNDIENLMYLLDHTFSAYEKVIEDLIDSNEKLLKYFERYKNLL